MNEGKKPPGSQERKDDDLEQPPAPAEPGTPISTDPPVSVPAGEGEEANAAAAPNDAEEPREDNGETTEARSIAAEVVSILVEEGYLSDVDPEPEPPKNRPGRYSDGIANVIQSAGGVIVATFGLVTVLSITVNLVDNVAQDQRAALITTAFTVIGTLVGGYIGARAGGAGRDEAEKARDRESRRVEAGGPGETGGVPEGDAPGRFARAEPPWQKTMSGPGCEMPDDDKGKEGAVDWARKHHDEDLSKAQRKASGCGRSRSARSRSGARSSTRESRRSGTLAASASRRSRPVPRRRPRGRSQSLRPSSSPPGRAGGRRPTRTWSVSGRSATATLAPMFTPGCVTEPQFGQSQFA